MLMFTVLSGISSTADLLRQGAQIFDGNGGHDLRLFANRLPSGLKCFGHHRLESLRCPILDQIRLARLSRSPQNHWLATGTIPPLGQRCLRVPLQVGLNFSTYSAERQLDFATSPAVIQGQDVSAPPPLFPAPALRQRGSRRDPRRWVSWPFGWRGERGLVVGGYELSQTVNATRATDFIRDAQRAGPFGRNAGAAPD